MASDVLKTRRDFLVVTGAAGAGLLLAGCSGEEKKRAADLISAPERLMRQHGVLSRLLMILEESLRRVDAHMELPLEVIPGVVEVVQNFVQMHHEKQEEEEIFPLLANNDKLVGLIAVLKAQHRAGREITARILEYSSTAALKELETRRKLNSEVRQLARMYRAHSNREDTVLFPALDSAVTAAQYRALSAGMTQKQQQAPGDGAFEKTVERVAALEKLVAMDDLAGFSPDAS